MPLPAGRLFEYGIMSGLPLMFSANAFAKYRDGSFRGFRIDAASAKDGRLPSGSRFSFGPSVKPRRAASFSCSRRSVCAP